MLELTVGDFLEKIKSIFADKEPDISARLAFLVLATIFAGYWYIGIKYFIFAGAAIGADNSSHLAEIIRVAALLREGRFDSFWFSQSNLGYPLFTGYNILPYLFMGTLVALTQTFWQPMHVYNTSIIMLHALAPLCWYGCGRWLRLPRLTSVCFALMPVFMVEYTSFGLHAVTTMGMGLYTQLWALSLFPFVLVCYYRFLVLEKRGGMLTTILSHSLLCSVHNLLGFFAGLGGLLFLLLRRRCWRKYLVSQAVILLLFSYWIVAWFIYHPYLVKIVIINHPMYSDGFINSVMYLIGGEFFDSTRSFPTLTLLLAVGALVIFRSQTVLQAWAVYFFIFGFFMMLYAPGDSLLGRVLPFFQEIPYRRYTAIMQMGGALIIAWGASYLLLRGSALIAAALNIASRVVLRDIVIIITVLLLIHHIMASKSTFSTFNITDSFNGAANFLRNEKHARFLVHSRFGTNSHFFRNLLPLLADRSQLTTYARGIRDSISSYYTTVFDFAPLSYQLFNVRYLVTNRVIPMQMHYGFYVRARFDDILIYTTDDDYGYFDVVQSNFAVTSFTSEAAVEYLRRRTNSFYVHGILPRLMHTPPADMPFVAFENGEARHYLRAGDAPVDAEQFDAQVLKRAFAREVAIEETVTDNEYRAKLDLDAPAQLLLKASYHPGWQATLHGKPIEVYAVAPNLMAVSLPAGKHEVVYAYRNALLPSILFLLCAVTWLVLLVVRLSRRPTASRLLWWSNARKKADV